MQMKTGGESKEGLLLEMKGRIDIGGITSSHCHIGPCVLLLFSFFFRESLFLITCTF